MLIVDDDPETIKTFSRWLQLEGYEVRTATDGEAALREAPGVDAIVLDVRMPILDGLEVLRRLRRRDEHVPVAIVTGDYLIDEAELNELHKLDAQVLFKPLWLEELVALTTGLVERHWASV